jgi:hypothetical protein
MAKPNHDTVRIHIEKKQVESPNPTNGSALYTLGSVPVGYDLFREVHGKGDDEFIANDGTSIALKNGDHFYFAQSMLNPGAGL